MTNCLLNLPLAQAPDAAKSISDRLADLPVPSRDEVLTRLGHLEPYQAAILLVAGVVYMLWGLKIFRSLVTLNLAALGFALGSAAATMLAESHQGDTHLWWLYGGLIGAVVLGALAWPMMKFAVALMGAAAGAFAGYHLWQYIAIMQSHQDWLRYNWAGGLAGLLLVGTLTLVLFRFVIMLFTSLQGAVLAMAGSAALVLHNDSWRDAARDHLLHDRHLLPLLVIGTTLVGFLFQAISLARKKPAPAAEGEAAKK